MNLIGDPWIPVVLADSRGERQRGRLVGLQELYERCSEIRDLALPPPQRIAVMRLLLCITQAALDGPQDEEDWQSCRERIVPESLRYLKDRCDKFDLFGPQPFLQVKDLRRTDNATLDKLDFGLAAGNNSTLFDQEAGPEGRPHSDAWVAMQLLTYQCFSPGGTIGVSDWNGKPTGGNSEHAPCVESSLLLALVRGSSLLATLHLNLVTKEMLQGDPFGQPVWDRFPKGQKDKTAEELARSYLGRLVPLSRAILLGSDGRHLTLVNGLSYPKFPIVRDAMATVVLRGTGKNEKPAYLSINLQKHPWRELGAILSARHVQSVGSPYALKHLLGWDQESFDLWVGGLVADRGKLIDTAEWNFTIPAGLLQTACLAIYARGVERANQGGEALRSAVKEYCSQLKLESGSFTTKAVPAYWSILDSHSGELLTAANEAASLEPWLERCRRAMRDAYAAACPHDTPRQIEALAAGRRRLYLAKLTDGESQGDAS